MSKMTKGRVPVTQKPAPRRISAEDAFGGGSFELPDHIKEDMKAKGFEPRWVNSAEVYKNQGYHKKGWKIYRDAKATSDEFRFGSDPDGIVRRGDCILAYKDKDASFKHKAFLKQQSGENDTLRSRQKEEMMALAEKLGVSTHIDDSDDDET